jgi:speckle-type POZ protein
MFYETKGVPYLVILLFNQSFSPHEINLSSPTAGNSFLSLIFHPAPGYQTHFQSRMAEHCKISAVFVAEEMSYVAEEKLHFVLKLDGYSRAKEIFKTGEQVVSNQFTVGGHTWAVRYFPNGVSEKYANFISVYLLLKSASEKGTKATFTLSVLDKDGEPVRSFSRTVHIHTFSRGEASDWGHHDMIKKVDLEGSEHLRDDCLTMRCDIVMKENHDEETSDLHRHLGNLLKSKDAADVTFQVGGEWFSAHRCILAARSTVFKAELLGAMKESSPGSPIEIRDMEADVFNSLLHFIYTESLPPPESATNKGAEAHGDLVMAGHLLVAADRYDIGRLKLICEKKLCDHMDSDMVATNLALAEQHGFHGLKKACLKFLACASNLKAMVESDGFEHLKSSCPSVVKELIARVQPAELKAKKDLVMEI